MEFNSAFKGLKDVQMFSHFKNLWGKHTVCELRFERLCLMLYYQRVRHFTGILKLLFPMASY
jgi:hypothetical protein